MVFIETLLLIVTIVVLFSVWWYKTIPKNLPPGPIGLPFFGSALNSLKHQPHVLLEKYVNQYGPLVSFYMGKQLVLLLGNYEAIDEGLIKQADIFSGRPFSNALNPAGPNAPRSGVIATDGAEWKEQRRFALSTLRDFGLGRPILQEKITEEVEYLLSDISSNDGRPFDIQLPLTKAVSNVICSMVYGHRFEDPAFWDSLNRMNYRISQSQVTIMTPLIYFSWMTELPFIKQKFAKFRQSGYDHMDYLRKVIKETAATFNPSDLPNNFVHAFLKAKSDNMGSSFTETQLVATVGQLFAAGSETTSTTLRWGVILLARNLDMQEKIYREIVDAIGVSQLPTWEDRNRLPYTEACIMEIQRIANLVPMSVIHRTMSDTKLMGYDIPKDTWVIPFLWNVLKDPKYFPHPDKCDPNRFLDENNKIKKEHAFIPFSAGKRICLGESLAKMELFLFFTSMVMRFKFVFPEGNPAPVIKRIVGTTMTPSNFEICAKKREYN